MEGEARMSVEPLPHFRMLVGGVVVEDHVHDLSGRHLRLDGVEEADKLLMTMALHAAANDLAFKDIESGEQRRCAMSFVVVGHRAGAALLHRQAGLRAVERLDLRLFVDREDDGMGGRIDIKPDHVAQLVDELRVVGELELPNPVWLQTMRAPDALNGTRANADGFGIEKYSASSFQQLNATLPTPHGALRRSVQNHCSILGTLPKRRKNYSPKSLARAIAHVWPMSPRSSIAYCQSSCRPPDRKARPCGRCP